VGAGFPLDRALGTVARVAARADVADAVTAVRARVRAGAPLADGLAEHPRIFPRLAVGMARAGERGGHLSDALLRLADQLEREQALRARLLSAMLYPAVMLVAGASAIVVLLLFVLPRLVSLLEETGAALPRSTAILLATADLLRHRWPLLILLLGATTLFVSAYRGTAAGGLVIDRLLLRIPLIGSLRRQIAAARLGRALATLLSGGLPVLTALDVAGHALADRAATQDVQRAREEVRAGGRLARALGRGSAFPFVFIQMVDVGEDGGRLAEMLERGATAMEQSLERGLERLVRLAEPMMILLFGGIVGFIALALLRAIYGVHAGAF
jgi:type II secretory pathway component PulF